MPACACLCVQRSQVGHHTVASGANTALSGSPALPQKRTRISLHRTCARQAVLRSQSPLRSAATTAAKCCATYSIAWLQQLLGEKQVARWERQIMAQLPGTVWWAEVCQPCEEQTADAPSPQHPRLHTSSPQPTCAGHRHTSKPQAPKTKLQAPPQLPAAYLRRPSTTSNPQHSTPNIRLNPSCPQPTCAGHPPPDRGSRPLAAHHRRSLGPASAPAWPGSSAAGWAQARPAAPAAL